MKKILIGIMVTTLATMTISGCKTKPEANGTLKGVVLYYHNQYIGTRPDIGAQVYVCRTKTDLNKLTGDLLDSKEIDDYIKTYLRYFEAETLNNTLRLSAALGSKSPSDKISKDRLKQLGADTASGWEEIRDKGWQLLFDLKRNQIPSDKITVGGDGTFTLELRPGYYFVIMVSKMREPDTNFDAITISSAKTTNISAEFR